ncbi:MAG: nucleoside diphosphate kinase regulator [Verrucomicrobiaceae bacterium]|nr:MAG: nucleoside diphosphate kinase regulator [Verrucomicrobiaceae bacterium]
MKNNPIQITEFDASRLGSMLNQAVREGLITDAEAVKLRAELRRAKMVAPGAVPSGVVTMNSTLDLLDIETGEPETWTLVFPEDADALEGRVSVLSPIGTAVLGCRVGDIIESEVPAGVRRLAIQKIVYQPEAAGDFHL